MHARRRSAAAKTDPTPPLDPRGSNLAADLCNHAVSPRCGECPNAAVRTATQYHTSGTLHRARTTQRAHTTTAVPWSLTPAGHAARNVRNLCAHVRRETPGQTLGGTFGTHSVSQAAAVSPAGESSNSRVRICKLARSMAFRMFSLQVDTCRRRLYSGVRPSAAMFRAFVSAAEWWGRQAVARRSEWLGRADWSSVAPSLARHKPWPPAASRAKSESGNDATCCRARNSHLPNLQQARHRCRVRIWPSGLGFMLQRLHQ